MSKVFNFEVNEKGGWIVPACTVFEKEVVFPDYCEFGDFCKFGYFCKFGDFCEFDDYCEFGRSCKFGNSCKFGSFCKFGYFCKFGHSCEFGHYCKFGHSCEFGNSCNIPKGCILEDVIMQRWTTLSNLDGSGRQILIIVHEGGAKIRAGCFCGNLDAFVAKVKSEGKEIYAKVVPLVANSLV